MAARWKEANFYFPYLDLLTASNTMTEQPLKLGVCTYEGGLVGHGGQDVIQDEQQYRDGQQHSDFEAQLLSSVVSDEEGGEVQTQEEQDGKQEVDDMEEGPPLHGDLRKTS